jgi:single-strand DNA-binding protein
MSLHAVAVGTLVGAPAHRTGQSGKDFATGDIRVAAEGESVFVSLIAFGDQAQQLLADQQGATIAVSGRAKLTSWTGRDGVEKHGLSLMVFEITSVAKARRANADRRQEARQ